MSALSTESCSLVDELIEIQKTHAEANEKSIGWVRNLKCLSVIRGSSNTLRETRVKVKDMNAVRDYIAVSYSCEPMEEYEDVRSKGYTIKTEKGFERENEVRDIVIFRVQRFAEHIGSSLFWIDKECVESTKKQAAMDSMDRIYHKSKHPVGLISTEIRDERHVRSLASLLCGNVFENDGRDAPSRLADCDEEIIMGILDLLELLQKDRWWQRAWIFQEEYLGGQSMTLLIRHTQDLELLKQEVFATDSDYDEGDCPVTFINGEIDFPAALLREQTTRFLLALSASSNVSRALQERCDFLLSCFSKYNILYDKTEANRKAMSPMVFADIAARDISRPYDILPITANCCNYGSRLNSQALTDEWPTKHSVGVCALAMYLINGELIRDVEEMIPDLSTAVDASHYIDKISFCDFDPPVGSGQLTWLKSCRLSNVKLHQDGLHTKGHLWRVYDRFRITNWSDAESTRLKPFKAGLEPHERDRLFQFALRLRKAERSGKIISRRSQLSNLIENHLGEDFNTKEPNATKHYMDTMAGEIVRVINDDAEQWLSLAVLEGSDEAFAVFVGHRPTDSHIFTSWSSGIDKDKRERTRHVSLEVQLVRDRAPPLMRCTGWINGLTFWRGHRQEKATFCWPTRWKEKSGVSRKRKRVE